MIDLSPEGEESRIAKMATTIICNLYPLGYDHGDTHQEALGHNRCIETARALRDTLRAFSIPAKLMPVDVVARNPLAHHLAEQRIPIDQWPSQAWSIGIVDDDTLPEPTTGGGWNGHMLVRTAHEWLCDPNAGQFYRASKIHMPPLVGHTVPKGPMGC